jgi:hypothetical protein
MAQSPLDGQTQLEPVHSQSSPSTGSPGLQSSLSGGGSSLQAPPSAQAPPIASAATARCTVPVAPERR